METILIAGATGLIGSELHKLLSAHHTVRVLTRKKIVCDNSTYFYWNPETGEISPEAFSHVNTVINLSGENIGAQRWTKSYKYRIQQSRLQSTRTLAHAIAKYGNTVTTYISSSAVGYYGNKANSHLYTENDQPGTDFMAETCRLWELEVVRIAKLNIKTIIIRTGVVLTNKGGMLKKISASLPFRILPLFGHGTNYIPWIHSSDLCSFIAFCITNTSITGIYNAVANNCTQREFMHTIQQAYSKRTFILPIPASVISLFLGEMATIVLSGNQIANNKLRETGFVCTNTQLLATLKKEFTDDKAQK